MRISFPPAIFVLRLAVSVLLPGIAHVPRVAAECVDYTQSLHWAGSIDSSQSPAGEVAVVGSYAYLACYDAGLRVIDISDPGHPQLIGTVDTPGSAWDVDAANGFVYVAGHSSGVEVINVSDPALPFIVTTVATPRMCLDIAVAGR
jgi:hypothetical protein